MLEGSTHAFASKVYADLCLSLTKYMPIINYACLIQALGIFSSDTKCIECYI